MATMISLQHQASNGGGTTDEETEVQRGSLSRSTRESESQARTLSLAPPPLLVSGAQLPPHRHFHILTENQGSTQAGAGADPGPGNA